MASLAARSPRSRKSLSLSEANMNRLSADDGAAPTAAKSNKKRGVSIGGEGPWAASAAVVASPARPAVAVAVAAVTVSAEVETMSPRRKARRSLKPRKSILKSFNFGEDATTDFSGLTQQYAHTISFGPPADAGRPGLARRVSFAPNAHVRMFEPPPKASAPRHSVGGFVSSVMKSSAKPSHSRRSSITNMASLKVPAAAPAPAMPASPRPIVRIQDVGEESMDIESDSGSDEDNVSYVSNAERSVIQPAGDDAADDDDDDADDDERDMEETGVYGGVLGADADMSGATDATADEDSRVEAALDNDEEKTMDFTIAVGGVMPHSPPVGAQAGRASIGYSMHDAATDGARLLPGHGPADHLGEGEVEMEMDETVAYGGIIHDDSLSSADDTVGSGAPGRERTMTFSFARPGAAGADDDEDAMDMTVAHGGVVSSATATHGFPASPHPAARLSDAGHTPSFARATASSARKSTEKRNVFAPSPSPSPTKAAAAAATPVRGMAAAGDVAKRLSFGSATSSGGGRKRAREQSPTTDENGVPSSAGKRPRVVADEVFAPTPPPAAAMVATGPLAALPRLSLGTPRRSLGTLGTPVRFKSPARPAIVPEPEELAFEPAPADDGDEEWDEADAPPTISLPAFLEMAGVQFMETLPLLNRRRSSVGRGVLGQAYAGDREFALHEYTEAQVHSVFLNMYNWASDKMKDDLRLGADELAETEAVCSAENPPVVREYLAAPDEDRPLFEMTFKTFKTNTMLRARERWYDWKMSLMERIRPDVREFRDNMEADRDRLAAEKEEVDTLLPQFHERMAALKAELERERAAVKAIATCDQAELADYKAAIAEQNTAIDMFRREVDEATAKADDLQARLDELEAVKREHVTAIASAKSKCDQFTKSDVARLQQEYASLQQLHLWRPTRITPALFEAEYDHELRLAVPCRAHVPDCAAARVELVGKRDGATPGLFAVVCAAVAELKAPDLGSLVRQTGQLWSAAQRMRQELRVLAFRHPVTYALADAAEGAPAAPRLVATAAVVLAASRSKVLVDFAVGARALRMWPDGVAAVGVAARTAYGPADADAFAAAVAETVESAVAYVPGVLVQGCVDAAAAA